MYKYDSAPKTVFTPRSFFQMFSDLPFVVLQVIYIERNHGHWACAKLHFRLWTRVDNSHLTAQFRQQKWQLTRAEQLMCFYGMPT